MIAAANLAFIVRISRPRRMWQERTLPMRLLLRLGPRNPFRRRRACGESRENSERWQSEGYIPHDARRYPSAPALAIKFNFTGGTRLDDLSRLRTSDPKRSTRVGVSNWLAEAYQISKRVDHSCLKGVPRHPLQAGMHVTVIFGGEFLWKASIPRIVTRTCAAGLASP